MTDKNQNEIVPEGLSEVGAAEDPNEGLSEELMQQVSELSSQVIVKDKLVQGACNLLLASRRLYMMGLVDLSRRMSEIKLDHKEAVQAHLVHSMANQSLEEFMREDVLENLQKFVLPWVAATIASEAEEEIRNEREADFQKDQDRRTIPIELGFDLTTPSGGVDLEIDRDRPVIMASEDSWAIDELLTCVQQSAAYQKTPDGFPDLNQIRLVRTNTGATNEKTRDAKQLSIAAKFWAEVAQSQKGFDAMMGRFLQSLRRQTCDLLLVDELSRLAKGHSDRQLTAAANALKVVRRWGNHNGAAVVCGLVLHEPMTQEAHKSTAWQSITAYADVVEVLVVGEPGRRDILVNGAPAIPGDKWELL